MSSFFSSRRRHTRLQGDWSSDVCSSDLRPSLSLHTVPLSLLDCMRVIFAGTPEFARVALERLLAAGFTVPLVLTQPDRPAGRGMKLQASPVKQDRKSTRLNSSHLVISYAVFCLKKKNRER